MTKPVLTTTVPPPVPVTSNRLKPGVPPDFDSDRTKGRAFLNLCLLYIHLCATEFKDDQAMIVWVLSYMKSSRAALFTNHMLYYSMINKNTPRYASFEDFLQVFLDSFCVLNEATNAILHLKSTQYYQRSRTVDEFEDLVDRLGYKDDITIVVKFR